MVRIVWAVVGTCYCLLCLETAGEAGVLLSVLSQGVHSLHTASQKYSQLFFFLSEKDDFLFLF